MDHAAQLEAYVAVALIFPVKLLPLNRALRELLIVLTSCFNSDVPTGTSIPFLHLAESSYFLFFLALTLPSPYARFVLREDVFFSSVSRFLRSLVFPMMALRPSGGRRTTSDFSSSPSAVGGILTHKDHRGKVLGSRLTVAPNPKSDSGHTSLV